MLKSVYLGMLLLRQVLLKTMKHGLFIIFMVIFQVFLLFFLCWDPYHKGIVLYL